MSLGFNNTPPVRFEGPRPDVVSAPRFFFPPNLSTKISCDVDVSFNELVRPIAQVDMLDAVFGQKVNKKTFQKNLKLKFKFVSTCSYY